ncbi:NAD(P)/FAD-dependent oxidoreductase [Aspergillus stella-maris]|uniref:NAD(P)/FAD-dependent oxidoreductase n=1 Tax=Aspergillus stella-maris TaxID=1810926 RepID=UPI003CCD9C30
MTSDKDAPTMMAKRIVEMATEDPGLPRPSPSIAFWQEPPHSISDIQSPKLPDKVDYVIIGSGITACSVANTLLNYPALSNKRVAVFEARGLTSGATGRNGGHLVSPFALEFSMLSAAFGIEKAAEVARFSYKSMDRVYEVVDALDARIQKAAEVRRVTTVTNFLDTRSYERARESVRQFAEACPDLASEVVILTAEQTKKKYNFTMSSGAVEHPAGALWPYRLITGIFAKLLEQHSTRFSIDTNTPVSKVSYDRGNAPYSYTLETPRGSINAAQVVYCTNGFTSHLLPALRGKIFPLRGTMSTQTLSPTAPNHGAKYSWSIVYEPTHDPENGISSVGLYYLTQNAKTGDFYLGGEKQKYDEILVSDDTVVPDLPADNLAALMTGLFASPEETEFTTHPKRIWAGIMGFTADHMPLVGKLDSKWTWNSGDGEWIAAGFNGHGMDKCWLVGETLGGMIAGEDVKGKLPDLYQITDKRLEERMQAEIVPVSLFRLPEHASS